MLPFSKALVTGGAGFVGSHIVERLVNEDIRVIVVDDFSGGRPANLNRAKETGKVDVIKGSVNDKNLIKEALLDVDVVFHEAAIVSVQRSIEEPEVTNLVNIEGTRNLLEACSSSGVKRFIFASSAAVYGDSKILPRTEHSVPSPLSPYALSKYKGELLCREYYERVGIETVALRYFNIYGDRSSSKLYSGVINAFAERLIAGQDLIIYGNGSQSRDFINVADIVNANVLAASSRNIANEVFNVGTSSRTTILELAEIESTILLGHREPPITFGPSRKGDVKESWADISHIQNCLAFKPSVTLDKGLQEYLSSQYQLTKFQPITTEGSAVE